LLTGTWHRVETAFFVTGESSRYAEQGGDAARISGKDGFAWNKSLAYHEYQTFAEYNAAENK
jgi:hypothetical protein